MSAFPKWPLETRQKLWTMFILGTPMKTIAQEVEHTIEECQDEIHKITTGIREKSDRIEIKGPDRKGRIWTKRQIVRLKQAQKYKQPIERIAELLGRSEEEITKQLNPRVGKKRFWE